MGKAEGGSVNYLNAEVECARSKNNRGHTKTLADFLTKISRSAFVCEGLRPIIIRKWRKL